MLGLAAPGPCVCTAVNSWSPVGLWSSAAAGKVKQDAEPLLHELQFLFLFDALFILLCGFCCEADSALQHCFNAAFMSYWENGTREFDYSV